MITPQTYRVEDFEQRFDRDLSGPIFGWTARPAIHMQHELDLRLGDGIRLRAIRSTHRGQAGRRRPVTLYWQAGKPLQTAYSVFTQIIDMTDYHKAGQRDGEPSATNCRATSGWAIPSSTATTFPSLPARRPASTGCWSACMTAKPATASTSSRRTSARATPSG